MTAELQNTIVIIELQQFWHSLPKPWRYHSIDGLPAVKADRNVIEILRNKPPANPAMPMHVQGMEGVKWHETVGETVSAVF